jgi:glucokinase
MNNQYSIGVDVGGTNIKIGIINPKGGIAARSRIRTIEVADHKNMLMKAMADAILSLIISCGLKKEDMDGIGIGLPGLVNYETGAVISLTNIFGWKNVPIKKMLEADIALPVFADNDVNVIALAEGKYGAAKGYKDFLCITLGTGVGGGIVLDGKLYRGAGFAAGEIGHVPLNENGPRCNCGGTACFEVYVGNGPLREKAIKLFKNKNMDLPDVAGLAQKGDRKALAFWEDVGRLVGLGLTGSVNLLNPELIVIGGGISESLPYMKTAIKDTLRQRAMPFSSGMVKIVRAALGDDAGILGGQALIRESLRDR